MDDLDIRIISELQDNFALEINPYELIDNNLGISVDDLWSRITALMESGAIRRLGFSLDSRALGYASTLAAIRVSSERVQAASETIAQYPEVTHSYLRSGDFNIWFTVIAQDKAAIEAILEQIRNNLGLSEQDLMNLPVKKMFKLDARFK